MREIYEKSELRFALIWIGIYVVLMSAADGVSETIGAAKIVTAPICAGLVLAMYLWIRRNGLKEKYGLCPFQGSAKQYLFFIPLVLLASTNLWWGVRMNYSPAETALYVVSMLCVGFLGYTAMDFARLVWMSLEDLVSGLVSVSDMSGPVGIVSTISEVGNQSATVRDGLQNIAYLGAFIAINLAVMNMLPLPALDGGRIFLLLVNSLFTAITKKKIPAKYEAYVHAAGMVLLLGFMAFVTFKDIWKLFT